MEGFIVDNGNKNLIQYCKRQFSWTIVGIKYHRDEHINWNYQENLKSSENLNVLASHVENINNSKWL